MLLACVFSIFSVRADLEVNRRRDKVVLVDGTEIECLVLMETKSGVLIVEVDPKDKDKTAQRVIPIDTVAKVIHGKPDGTIAGFQTDKELAHKVVQGTGFRKEESVGRPKESLGEWGQTTSLGSGEKPVAHGNTPASALSVKELQDAYMARFPELKDAAAALVGPDRTTQLLDLAQKGDPLVRKQMENFLGLFVRSDAQPQATAAPAEGTTPVVRPIKVKPGRPGPANPKEKPDAKQDAKSDL
jgi:hypothetical protein